MLNILVLECPEIRKVVVKDNGQLVPNLNELEYIHGDIWANVYQVMYSIPCSCLSRVLGAYRWFACGECSLGY